MPWKFGQALHIGKRNVQQDRTAIFHKGGDTHLLVVADGMGGIPRGERAAQTVLDTAERMFRGNKITEPAAFLEDVCFQSHDNINRLAKHASEAPGTTCVLLYVCKRLAYWAHIGDSRLYHFRQDQLIHQTSDHSLLQMMIDQRSLKADSEEAKQLQNQLVKRLGGQKDPEPEMHENVVDDGDVFMLCSDGFWQSVEKKLVPMLLKMHPIDQNGAERLVDIALKNGGADCDNIGIVLAQWEKKRSLLSRIWPS